MADPNDTGVTPESPAGPAFAATPRPHWRRRIGIALASLLALLIVIVAAGYIWLSTDNGRRFVVRQVEALRFDNGMTIGMGRIDGSIFGAMRVHDLALRDPKGVFLTVPRLDVDWRPLAFIGKHLDVRSLVIPDARLHRAPQFNQTPPSEGPLLPDLDIDVNRLAIAQLHIDPALTGQRHVLGLAGKVHIADRRAQIEADGKAIAAPGIAGGDMLRLVLDAVPDANRLTIDLHMRAPANGLVAGFTGVEQPLDLGIAGKGDWKVWDGRLSGTMGADRLANVTLAARDGSFAVRGPIRPGLFLTGPGRAMLEPVTRVDLTARAEQRRVRISGGVTNDHFTFGVRGLVDLGASRMQDLALDFRLIKPGAIAENLRGADIAATAMLNGDFAAPRIAYDLTARQIGFGATSIEGLAVSGSAALDKEQWRIPVEGRARRITGVNESIAPLLTNARIDGDLAYANGRLMSDTMKVRTDRIDATAVIVADLPRALYTGALNGRVNGYRVESVGTFNLHTDMDLKSGSNGAFRLGGRVTARSTRLLNDSLHGFLGGNALIVADVGYDSNGVATLDRLRVAAPAFRVTQAQGRYGADGSLRFAARADSDQYGPLGVDVTGSAERPLIRLAAARPGMGIGLAGVTATVRGEGGTYMITGEGSSDYGPLRAHIAAITGRGPLSIEVRPGTAFSGVNLTGRLTQSAAGPFAGTLLANGSGMTGQVRLANAGGNQRALIDATARQARLDGPVGLTLDRGIIRADATLAQQPRITADMQVAGLRMGELFLAGARGDIVYEGGRGQAKLLAEGRTRYPFRLAANAHFDPRLWRVALNGRLNGVDITTRAPMEIGIDKGRYSLRPATLSVGDGTLQLAGDYGGAMALQARLNTVNLGLINPFLPGLGLGGTASGSLDFAQASADALPTGDARLKIDNFTRTSLAAVSEPVDIDLVGRLSPDGGSASSIIRRRGAAIGRMQVHLRPLPSGAGNWSTRLMAAPLSGGVRYNGPADVLFSLAALADQSLKGPIGLAADFGGRLNAPHLTGVVRANKLTYENAQYGTKLTDMQLRGTFTNDRLQVESLTARAGTGTVSASGFVSLNADQGYPIQLGIDLRKAQLAKSQGLEAEASGNIQIVSGAGQPPTIKGTIDLPETHYQIVYQGSTQVATLTGVRHKPAPGRQRISGAPEPMQTVPSNWNLDVRVKADNKIYVTGMGLNSEWAADIRIAGTSSAPKITGGVRLVRGTLGFAGHSFDLQQGRLTFNGGDMTDPDINILAAGEVEDVTITIAITGTGSNPEITLTSVPDLPQDELMARILFGNSVGELSPMQAVQLAASLNSLRGGKGGLNPLGVLQSAGGIDRLRLLGADEESGRGTSLAVGQYISNDIYVEIVTDARGYTATQLEVALSKALSVLSAVGSFGGSSVNLRYRKDY